MRDLSRPAGVALAGAAAVVGGIAAALAVVLFDRSGGNDCRPDAAYTAIVLSDGALGYWRLDERTGSAARNLVSGGRAGKYVGRDMLAYPRKSPDGRIAALDGNDEYVIIPAPAPYRNLTRWSVEAWVDPRAPMPKGADVAFLTPAWHSSSLPFVLAYGSYDGAYADARHAWAGFYSSGGFYRELLGMWSRIGDVTGTWSRAVDPAPLRLERWTHLVGTYDGRTIRLYRNGVLTGSAAAAGTPPAAAAVPLYIGSRWWLRSKQFFSGSVADVALYPDALTRDEVEKHYHAVKAC